MSVVALKNLILLFCSFIIGLCVTLDSYSSQSSVMCRSLLTSYTLKVDSSDLAKYTLHYDYDKGLTLSVKGTTEFSYAKLQSGLNNEDANLFEGLVEAEKFTYKYMSEELLEAAFEGLNGQRPVLSRFNVSYSGNSFEKFELIDKLKSYLKGGRMARPENYNKIFLRNSFVYFVELIEAMLPVETTDLSYLKEPGWVRGIIKLKKFKIKVMAPNGYSVKTYSVYIDPWFMYGSDEDVKMLIQHLTENSEAIVELSFVIPTST